MHGKKDRQKNKTQTNQKHDTLRRGRKENGSRGLVKRRMVVLSFGNTCNSPKREDIKATPPPQPATNTEATRQFTRNRRATLTSALGNPTSINTSNLPRNFSIKPPEQQTTATPSNTSINSFILEMAFEKDSPEFLACIKFHQMIKAKKKDSKSVSVKDLFFPSERPNKTTLTEDKTKEEANTA